MSKTKFLTVYGVFDTKTQQIFHKYKTVMEKYGLISNQTKIPYHISFGSFATHSIGKLIDAVNDYCQAYCPFSVELDSVDVFDTKVAYIKPAVNRQIYELHSIFDSNYADGFDFVPHVTMYMGKDTDVIKARGILAENFTPFCGQIDELHIGEFFPAKVVYTKKMLNNK